MWDHNNRTIANRESRISTLGQPQTRNNTAEPAAMSDGDDDIQAFLDDTGAGGRTTNKALPGMGDTTTLEVGERTVNAPVGGLGGDFGPEVGEVGDGDSTAADSNVMGNTGRADVMDMEIEGAEPAFDRVEPGAMGRGGRLSCADAAAELEDGDDSNKQTDDEKKSLAAQLRGMPDKLCGLLCCLLLVLIIVLLIVFYPP
jgi:hypothetical protein